MKTVPIKFNAKTNRWNVRKGDKIKGKGRILTVIQLKTYKPTNYNDLSSGTYIYAHAHVLSGDWTIHEREFKLFKKVVALK